jgi:hypothetical protein
MDPTRSALTGLIDYAGLFPPAGLDLPHVVANYVRYLQSAERWLLGRLIVPRARLDELGALWPDDATGGVPWTISVLGALDETLGTIGSDIVRFNERHTTRGVAAVAVEVPAQDVAGVERIARLVPERFERYVELPLDEHLSRLLDAAAAAGLYAKVRTGGLTADAVPAPAILARFMTACAVREVPFKATAGLHHPFRGSYPLTYEPQSASATMHGFLNLAVAGALLYTRRIGEQEAAEILGAEELFVVAPEGLRWRTHTITGEELSFSRAHLFRSVGSCSFEDALGDLRRSGWLE